MPFPIGHIEEAFWSYLRGETDEKAFEAWIYATPRLEEVLGQEDYLTLIELDYGDTRGGAWIDRRKTIQAIVTRRFPRRCRCCSIPNGSSELDALGTYEVIARRTPWIELVHCKECDSDWLVGNDTVDDFVILYRLSAATAVDIVANGRWPPIFEDRPNLWPRKDKEGS